jgi:hypothetical protein
MNGLPSSGSTTIDLKVNSSCYLKNAQVDPRPQPQGDPIPALGGFDSPEFKSAIRYTKACWRQLFNTWPPFSGSTVNDYITENVLDLRTLG